MTQKKVRIECTHLVEIPSMSHCSGVDVVAPDRTQSAIATGAYRHPVQTDIVDLHVATNGLVVITLGLQTGLLQVRNKEVH